MTPHLPIFDAHLDLAMNVQRGRDVRLPAAKQPPDRGMIATVGLPDLRRGGVTHCCATIFCPPDNGLNGGYKNADEAFALATQQIETYHVWQSEGLVRLPNVGSSWHGHPARVLSNTENMGEAAMPQNMLLLLEGADCIRTADDLPFFYNAGVRLIGLSWHRTRYAGGTGDPGPLTIDGRAIVGEIDRHGFIHDVSHLAEASFWELLQLSESAIVASHSNCRALVGDDPGERHLSDAMIHAIAQRDGVIGINVYDQFLLPHDQYKKRRATLEDVVAHIHHVCDIVGDAKHVGIGTDMDGGLGRMEIPVEIETSADLPLIGRALVGAGFSERDVRDILFNNWHRRLIENAPALEEK